MLVNSPFVAILAIYGGFTSIDPNRIKLARTLRPGESASPRWCWPAGVVAGEFPSARRGLGYSSNTAATPLLDIGDIWRGRSDLGQAVHPARQSRWAID